MPFPQPPFNSPVQSEPTIFGVVKIKAVWQNWLQLVQTFLASLTNSGPTSARPTKDLWVGQPFFDTTINVPVYWNGSTWVTSAPAGTVTNVTGTAPIQSSGGTTPDISITQSNASTNGYLSNTDWSTFNNKVSSVSATSPVTSTGGSTPVIAMPAANGSTNGYLTSTDWTTFNNKQPAGTYVNSVGATSPVASSGGTSPIISMPAANSTTSGYLTSTDWNTFNSAASNSTFINVKSYGATGNGSTDDTTSIQNAINANLGRTIYFPKGTYAIGSTINVTNGTCFCGDGPSESLIKVTSASSDVFNVTTNDPCGFRDLGFIAGTTRTGGAYVKFDPASNSNKGSYFFNVGMDHPYIGINFVDAYIFLVQFCYFTSYITAIRVEDAAHPDQGDSQITNCTFDAGTTATGVAIDQYSSGGLKITANKFLAGTYQYLCQFNASTSIVVITGNSFESASVGLVAFNSTSAAVGCVDISGNQFSPQISGSRGIIFFGSNFNNVYIGGNEFNCAGNITAISFGGGRDITLGPNQYYDTGGGGTAIDFSPSNPGVYVLPQSMNNFASNFTNVGSNQRFCVGQEQHGTGSYSGGYGAYGAVFITGGINVSFAHSFPATPTVNVTLDNPGSGSSGAIGVLVRNVSASGFTIYIVTAGSSGTVYYAWSAYTTGQ